MSTYTKGPWKSHVIDTINEAPALWHIRDAHGVVATVESVNESDAKLIASAPELLAMLHRVVHLLNDPDADAFDANQLEREIEQLITKATR
jgi:type VI protein secretion system component VasF